MTATSRGLVSLVKSTLAHIILMGQEIPQLYVEESGDFDRQYEFVSIELCTTIVLHAT